MGIWACLTCWNITPEPKIESYFTVDRVTEDNTSGLEILVEKLLITGISANVIATESSRYMTEMPVCSVTLKEKMPFKVSTTTAFYASNPPPKKPYEESRNLKEEQQQIIGSSQDSTEDEEDDEEYTARSASISRTSHRSELDDDTVSTRAQSIKLGPVGSIAAAEIQNPHAVCQEVYRDFILKYGSEFTNNIKDPIPKDPNPLNPSNIVKKKPLNLPSKHIDVSKSIKTVNYQSSIDKYPSSIDTELTSDGTLRRDSENNEIELYSTDTSREESSDTSESEQGDQTESYPVSKTLRTGYTTIPTENIKQTASSDGQNEIQDESTSNYDRHKKKALRWKIIIRHRTPSTEVAENMTEDSSSHRNRNVKDDASIDSGYLQNDYVED